MTRNKTLILDEYNDEGGFVYSTPCPNLLAKAGAPLNLVDLNDTRPSESNGPVALTPNIGFVSTVGSGPVPQNFSSQWPTGPSPDATGPGLAEAIPVSKLTESATKAARQAVEAAVPQPQTYDIPHPHPPGRTWRPTWNGVGSTFADSACAYYSNDERLFATDLNLSLIHI